MAAESSQPQVSLPAMTWQERGRHGVAHGVVAFVRARPLGALCGLVLLAFVCVAIFAGAIAPHKPAENHLLDQLRPPDSAYLLGTDNFGRDVFSRLVYGSRISIRVGALSTLVVILVSMTLGVVGTYLGGAFDYVVGRLVDLVQALPPVVLLIALLTIFGRSVTSIGVVLGLVTGVVGSRVVRAATLSLTHQQFVDAARALGCGPLRLMLRHLAPNVVPVVIVLATINVGTAIVAEASLSFIGYGVPPPAPSWGGMLSADGRPYMLAAPWLFYAPVVTLATLVFSVNMFGDALRDWLDPRLRGAR